MKLRLDLDSMTVGEKLDLILKRQDVEGLRDLILEIANKDEVFRDEIKWHIKDNELDIVEV